MLKSVRRDSVLNLLQTRGNASINEIADSLHVSTATVRRDIIALEKSGLVTRTWGGAIATGEDDPFAEALSRNGSAKQRIGSAAATLVHDGDTVILDVGTTALYAAIALEAKQITVITASLPIFEQLRTHANIRLILLGGRWSEAYQCLDGVGVIDALTHQQADIAFLGCSGISAKGRVRDTSYSQAAIKKAILQVSNATYLLSDDNKFPGRGSCCPFEVSALQGIITNFSLTPYLATMCKQNKVTVISA